MLFFFVTLIFYFIILLFFLLHCYSVILLFFIILIFLFVILLFSECLHLWYSFNCSVGDSAGENLAMALTKEKDAQSLPKIKLQALNYPALQAFDLNLPAYIRHGDGPGFLRKRNMIEF